MSAQDVQDWIGKTVAGNDVVLFMKGTPQFPMCGFSGQVVQILGLLFERIARHHDDDFLLQVEPLPSRPVLEGSFRTGCKF